MTALGIGLLLLGLVVVGMGLLDRRWGNAGWRVRFLTGLAVAGGGLYFLLRR
ncbi:MAG TPA: hypothetical protein VI729_13760 [Anaerolineales bacterium]|nr:hypothetical protein [Anaerolineales bacterium]